MSSSAKVRYSYDVGEDWSEKSIKKLIHDEMSWKSSTRQNVPSIVARLMGVDVLPPEARSAVHPIKKMSDETLGNKSMKKRSQNWNSLRPQFDDPVCYESDVNLWNSGENVEKPNRREHPQEEELQKFKKEFEAWQTARFRECSRFAQVEEISVSAHTNRNKSEKNQKMEEQQTIRYSAEKQKDSPLPLSRRAKGRVSGAGPTTIVVLKPGPDRIWSSDDSWTSFSGSSEERGSMEDFLEEVKERLKREVQGKAPPFPSETRQRTKPMAKKVRGLIRSESVHVDTRKLLAERLRTVLGNERPVTKHMRRPSYWESVEEDEMQARSFRHDQELSPKNLVRSLSAPVSGTSFGKLLLEDRHVITGAHIRRKHESAKNLLVDARKERFSFKEKVRSTFTLNGRLFGRRMQHSVAELQSCQPNFVNDIMSGPTVISNRNEIYENSTEVPPSPASVCSSVHEEFWRARNDDLSPLSPADTASPGDGDIVDDAEILPDFADLNTASSELQTPQLDQPESNHIVKPTSRVAELEDEALSFVRALLIASGVYAGSSHPYLNTFGKTINDSVFEQVEESYKEHAKETHHLIKEENRETDHKILHDLLNESLLLILTPPMIFPRKVSGLNFLPYPHGEKLLHSVWGMIRAYIELPHSPLHNLAACDMESAPWSVSLDTEVIVGEIQGMILADIVDEIVKGVHYVDVI